MCTKSSRELSHGLTSGRRVPVIYILAVTSFQATVAGRPSRPPRTLRQPASRGLPPRATQDGGLPSHSERERQGEAAGPEAPRVRCAPGQVTRRDGPSPQPPVRQASRQHWPPPKGTQPCAPSGREGLQSTARARSRAPHSGEEGWSRGHRDSLAQTERGARAGGPRQATGLPRVATTSGQAGGRPAPPKAKPHSTPAPGRPPSPRARNAPHLAARPPSWPGPAPRVRRDPGSLSAQGRSRFFGHFRL